MVSDIFPDIGLTADDVCMHHAGVRPLPKFDGPAAAIPRGHSLEESRFGSIPILTLVGGKLTTCRSLAEDVTHRVCQLSQHTQTNETTSRLLPGANKASSHSLSKQQLAEAARNYRLTTNQVAAVWPLIGNRFDEIFTEDDNTSIEGTNLPRQFVRWSIEHEWCTKLEDLVERRLMLIFHPTIHRSTLRQLADELARAGKFSESQVDTEVDKVCSRLLKFYGRKVTTDL